MQDGQLPAATSDVSAVARHDLHRRDALWAAALQTAIARRSGDSGAVQKHWYAAMEVLAEYSMDLYSLLPLGELWIVAARMHQLDRLEHTVDEAFDLLDRWATRLVVGAVALGRGARRHTREFPGAVAPHGQALTAAAGHSPFARAMAMAGRTWLRVLANQVDADEVTAAARSLAQFGLTWDATRLASQAALQTPDARVSSAMLQLARDLKRLDIAEAPGLEAPAALDARRGPGPPRVVAAVRPRARGRRTAAAGHAVPRHRQPTLHLGEDRRTPRRPYPPPAGRRVAVGDVVDVARDAGSRRAEPRSRTSRRLRRHLRFQSTRARAAKLS